MQRYPAGGAAVVNPGDFAAYVFTIAAAVGGLTVLGAVTRKILGGHTSRRLYVSKDGRKVVQVGAGDTDPASQQAISQLGAELDALREEVTGLRRELDEAQNRLDFTERLLGQAKERGLLSPPKDR